VTHAVAHVDHQPAAPDRDDVAKVIDRVRPAIRDDGGDVELVGITDAGVVQIRLHGACVGCPSSSMTLHMGIESALRAHVPGVTGVEQVGPR
jgi:Fe-S cluster biogenesis protein NfuA